MVHPAARLLREKGEDAERPWIIAVSASLQEDEVQRARDAGVNDFLGKPFFAGQLGEKIEAISWIEEKRVDPDRVEALSSAVAEPQHVPLFIGPASEDALVEEEPAARSVFGGIGSYPAEAVRMAVAEVYAKHEEMEMRASKGDWAMVREAAHYLANTAMALGIDQLYLDSKEVEAAAEREDAPGVEKGLVELKLNFSAWEGEE